MIARIIRRVSRILASLADAMDDRGAHSGESLDEDKYLTRLVHESRTGGGR